MLLFPNNSDESQCYLMKVSFSSTNLYDYLCGLKKGENCENICKIDPDASYNFLYRNYSKGVNISKHFFESGDCFYIQYTNNYPYIVEAVYHYQLKRTGDGSLS